LAEQLKQKEKEIEQVKAEVKGIEDFWTNSKKIWEGICKVAYPPSRLSVLAELAAGREAAQREDEGPERVPYSCL
jgi:hypothetical protein